MMYVDAKTYEHANISVLYIYFNYHFIFLKFIILKRISLSLIYMQEHYTSEDHMAMVIVISKFYCRQS